jgi:hypothetical protein
MPTVFQHGDQRVVVNENALPRSWIVHDVRLVERSRILHLLRSAREDPRTVAYVADGAALPALEPGADAAGESVRVVAREPDRITLEVTSDGDGLVVLSEMYADGWSAKVDGGQASVHEVNAALRGVVVPDGNHVIVMTYDPPHVRTGMVISALTAVSVLVACAVLVWSERARRHPARRAGAA